MARYTKLILTTVSFLEFLQLEQHDLKYNELSQSSFVK